MAKYGPKEYVGKVLKGKDKKPDYIAIDKDFQLQKGMFLTLVSPAQEIEGYQEAVEKGRMSEDKAADLIEKAEKKKAHTRFTIIYQEVTKD